MSAVAHNIMARRTERDAVNWQLLRAYLQRPGARVVVAERTVSVSFLVSVEATEFERLLKQARRKDASRQARNVAQPRPADEGESSGQGDLCPLSRVSTG